MVDFTVTDTLSSHRAAAAAWADEHFDPEWALEELRTGTLHSERLHQILGEEGVLGAGWPTEYGGSDVDRDLAVAIMSELEERGAHQEAWITTDMVLRTVLEVGTEPQKQNWVRSGLRGVTKIVLGYTEPDSGSDVAAAQLRAVRDGSDWILNGSKMFTSTAQSGTHVFLLTRTNTDVRKHLGLTMFLVPLDADGVEIQPVYTLGGQRTNATFYRDVRITDDHRIGEVDGGWAVMRIALVHERGTITVPSGPTLAHRSAQWARHTRLPDGTTVYDDAAVRERLARIAVDEEVSRLLIMNMTAAAHGGSKTGIEGAMRKMFVPEALQRNLDVLMGIVGPGAAVQVSAEELTRDDPESFPGRLEYELRNAPVETIYGGSSEIMREIIAERYLGLPKNRPAR